MIEEKIYLKGTFQELVNWFNDKTKDVICHSFITSLIGDTSFKKQLENIEKTNYKIGFVFYLTTEKIDEKTCNLGLNKQLVFIE